MIKRGLGENRIPIHFFKRLALQFIPANIKTAVWAQIRWREKFHLAFFRAK